MGIEAVKKCARCVTNDAHPGLWLCANCVQDLDGIETLHTPEKRWPLVQRFTVPLPPSANAYWRSAPGRGMVPSSAAEAYKATIAALALTTGIRPFFGRYELAARVILPSLDSDLGNRLKVLEDALNFVAFLDDSGAGRIVLDDGGDAFGRPVQRGARTAISVYGLRYATAKEIAELKAKKSEAKKKRRATLAKNRAGMAALGRGIGDLLSENVIRPGTRR